MNWSIEKLVDQCFEEENLKSPEQKQEEQKTIEKQRTTIRGDSPQTVRKPKVCNEECTLDMSQWRLHD